MKKNRSIILLGIIVVFVFGGYFIGTYNFLTAAENRVEAKWSQVGNVM